MAGVSDDTTVMDESVVARSNMSNDESDQDEYSDSMEKFIVLDQTGQDESLGMGARPKIRASVKGNGNDESLGVAGSTFNDHCSDGRNAKMNGRGDSDGQRDSMEFQRNGSISGAMGNELLNEIRRMQRVMEEQGARMREQERQMLLMSNKVDVSERKRLEAEDKARALSLKLEREKNLIDSPDVDVSITPVKLIGPCMGSSTVNRPSTRVNSDTQGSYRLEARESNFGHGEKTYSALDVQKLLEKVEALEKKATMRTHTPVDKYDGATAWGEYLVYFEEVCKENRWNDELKARQLLLHSKGLARQLLVEERERGVSTYSGMCEKLEIRFGTHSHIKRFEAEFQARSRMPGESIADFGYDLRRLVKLANPDASESMLDKLARARFHAGIGSKPIRDDLFLKGPETLDSAITIALHREMYDVEESKHSLDLERRNPKAKYIRQLGEPEVDPSKDWMARNTEALERLAACLEQDRNKNVSPMRNQTGKLRGSCYNCGGKGHYSGKCTSPKNADKELTGENRFKCFNCEGVGHMGRNCSSPAKRERYVQGNGNRPSLRAEVGSNQQVSPTTTD